MKSANLVAKAFLLSNKNERESALQNVYMQIEQAYELVEGMILNYYNPQIPNFHEMDGDFFEQDSAYALLHFLLAGDFFNRHEVYADFLAQLKNPKKFARYKNLVYKRAELENLSCKEEKQLQTESSAKEQSSV